MKLSLAKARELGITVEPARPKRRHVGDSHDAYLFDALCKSHGLPTPLREYRFAEPRRWRLDYFWAPKTALEIQGGLFTGGRHVRGPALLLEHEKLNEAAIRGIRVLFCTPADIQSGAIFPVILRAIDGVYQ